MKLLTIGVLAAWLGGGNPGGNPAPQGTQQSEKVIVVQLDVQYPNQVEKCFTPSFDKKKIELSVEFDDTINYLQDFIYEEDPIEGPGCFIPQMKLIYQDYTYVVSLYCTSVQKYKNSAPFTPSPSKLRNDLEITESVLDYLRSLHRRYFGAYPNPGPGVCQRFLSNDPLQADDKNDDVQFDDDEDVDRDVEKDLLDAKDLFDSDDIDDEIKPIEPDDE